MSRGDFLTDRKKLVREHPDLGMGSRRYYIRPEGIIRLEELLMGWGLIYYCGAKRFTTVLDSFCFGTSRRSNSTIIEGRNVVDEMYILKHMLLSPEKHNLRSA